MANPNPTHKFAKGQSGNPSGAPKKDWTFQGLYKEELEKAIATKDGKVVDAKAAVAARLVSMAIQGDIQAIRELGNRVEGMPKQAVNLGGDADLHITIKTTRDE